MHKTKSFVGSVYVPIDISIYLQVYKQPTIRSRFCYYVRYELVATKLESCGQIHSCVSLLFPQ